MHSIHRYSREVHIVCIKLALKEAKERVHQRSPCKTWMRGREANGIPWLATLCLTHTALGLVYRIRTYSMPVLIYAHTHTHTHLWILRLYFTSIICTCIMRARDLGGSFHFTRLTSTWCRWRWENSQVLSNFKLQHVSFFILQIHYLIKFIMRHGFIWSNSELSISRKKLDRKLMNW